MEATNSANDKTKKANETIQKYYTQLTKGCGKQNCKNKNCASNPEFKQLSNDQAASQAIVFAIERAPLCIKKRPINKHNEDAYFGDDDEDDDDNYDVIISRPTSSQSSTNNPTSSSTVRPSALSISDALKNAVNYLTTATATATSSPSSSSAAATTNNIESTTKNPNDLYLSENRLLNLIKKCKSNVIEARQAKNQNSKMFINMDENHTLDDLLTIIEYLKCFRSLFGVMQHVFQSYKLLAKSFNLKSNENNSKTIPSVAPFKIDFTSTRTAISTLYALNALVIEELELILDISIMTLCMSIRMSLKKSDTSQDELNEMLHALLIVNELPIIENPQYMEKCVKVFYATINELQANESAKIVRMWSEWSSEELKIFLNRVQQHISLCVMQKLEEDELKGESQEDDYDEIDEKTCLHKNEGLTGAVGFLRLIYYASILGGRMDPQSQLENERALEQTENAYFENIIAVEIQPTSGTIFTDIPSSNFLVTSKMIDPLEDLFKVRALDCREPKIPFDEFVNELANEHIDIQHDYVEYAHILQHLESRQNNNNGANTRSLNWTNMKKRVFSYLAHPFFLTLSKKNIGLYYDNKIKMMRERRNHIMLSILEGRSPTPFFKMRLTRENLLFNALSLIEMQEEENPSTLRKQLFIEFENEEGIDQGGLSKEFFQLAIDELLNKGFTFFNYDEKSKYYWISPCTLETEKEFHLVGILLGIAIYNNVILDVQFPPVFFRKLMGKLGTFEDLSQSHPELYNSLKQLLEFEGSEEDFQDTFMQTFQISITNNFGASVNFNLKRYGDKIPVTKENRLEFVDLYADFLLNRGIDESFKSLRRGFMRIVMGSPMTVWYSPQELEILLCGDRVMDWKSLENSTSYDNDFDEHHFYIKQFWAIFNEFTDEEKKLFLKFTTGSDRCAHGGLNEPKLTIARNGPDTEKLPTAHTCFNILLLPEYESKQKLKEKLIKAIQYSRGFGLS